MTTSRVSWTAGILALAALVPLDCRQATSEKKPSPAEKKADGSSELRADQVTDEDINSPSEKRADTAIGSAPPWRDVEMVRLEIRRKLARANWQITLRTDASNLVPCQPLYVTIEISNPTGQARNLRDLLGDSDLWMLVGREGEEPHVVEEIVLEGDIKRTVLFEGRRDTDVAPRGSVFFDRLLTTVLMGPKSAGSAPDRIFSKSGKYNVFVAVAGPGRVETLRSDPLAITVRQPTEAEAPYVEFFREGRQIPPYYGFSKVQEEAFDKLRGRGDGSTIAFRRKVDAETIDKLRAMMAKYPDPPVADDMRFYFMNILIRSARQYDEGGRDQGLDRDVLAAAARHYLDISPERKQLRRRGIKTWRDLSTRFDLDHAQPMLQILASWKANSPFYEDEVESQAALDKIIDKIETRYAEHAARRAAAPPPKRKLPTD